MTALQESQAVDARAAELHARAIVIDGQAGTPLPNPNLTVKGGVTAVTITVEGRSYDGFLAAGRAYARQLNFMEFYKDQVLMVRTADDIDRAKREGKVGIIFGFQSTDPLEDDTSLMVVFHALGVRYIQLTYMEHCRAGSGCLEPNDRGLTGFGQRVIRDMERLGILLDLSHVGRRTSLDALAFSRRPVVFSHANPAARYEMPRNVTDEEIRAVAATGGLVGITPVTPFYGPLGSPQPTVVDMVDHISYVADLVGIDHVATATDLPEAVSEFAWEMGAVRPYRDTIAPRRIDLNGAADFGDRSQYPNLTRELVRRGFSDTDILKVLGDNWMRVYREVWTPS